MYERLDKSTPSALGYRITDKLGREEVRQITDELEGAIHASGQIRVLLDLQAFPYRDLNAFWEDLKFDVKYAGNFERLALVGGGETEKWAVKIFGKLTSTDCRFFKEGQIEQAWNWLTGEKEKK